MTIIGRELKMHFGSSYSWEALSHCEYKTITNGTLKVHIKRHHTDEKPYQCPHCEYKTITNSELKVHTAG